METGPGELDRTVALSQGAVWIATGLWPIVHLPSFEAITGPKLEGWLVKTTGALIASVGSALALAGLRRRVTPELRWLGFSSAIALALVDVIYTSKRRIKPVYLLDAPLELAFAAGWALSHRRTRR